MYISDQKYFYMYKCTEMLKKNERLFKILRIISSKQSRDQLSRMDNTRDKLFHLSQESSELVSPVSSRSNKKFVKAGWLFRSGWLDGDHHHIYVSTTLIPCKEFKQFENPCSPYLHHFWLFSGRKYNGWFWWKSLPIEEAGLQKWWKVAMKIKLLVYCGEMLVEGLQLRKPEQDRVAWTRNTFEEERPFPCWHSGHIFRTFNRKCRTGDLQISFVMNSNAWVSARFTWPKGLS